MTLLLAALISPALASKELVNDGCKCDGTEENLAYQQGFVDGECWGSVYVPEPGDYPFELQYVSMAVGPDGEEVFDIFVHEVDGDNKPLDPLAGEAAQITGSDESLSVVYFADLELDLPTIESGNIAVSVCLDGFSGLPAVARDDDGLAYRDRNWIQTSGGWVQSSSYGLQGDWVMRLGISGGGDGDTDADSDTDTDSDGDTDTDGGLELYAISPATAKEGEAVNVVLDGAGFVTGAEVHIGGLALTGAEVQDGDTISGRTPTSLAAGVHDVDVVNPDGSSAYLAGAFTVEGACGCAATPRTGWLGVALLGLVVARRRR